MAVEDKYVVAPAAVVKAVDIEGAPAKPGHQARDGTWAAWAEKHKLVLQCAVLLIILGVGIGIGVGIGRGTQEDNSKAQPCQLQADAAAFDIDDQSGPILRASVKKSKGFLILGDSMSDPGNLAQDKGIPNATINGGYCPKGGFTDGDTWAELLESDRSLNVKVKNFAYGGATLCDLSLFRENLQIPDVNTQITYWEDFLKTKPDFPSPADTTVILWAGHNDMFNITFGFTAPGARDDLPRFARDSMRKALSLAPCAYNAIQRLVDLGHKQFIIWNLAPADIGQFLQKVPDVPGLRLLAKPILRGAQTATQAVMNLGVAAAEGVNKKSNIRIDQYNVADQMRAFYNNYKAYGFKSKDDKCVEFLNSTTSLAYNLRTIPCAKPSDYMWYDQAGHPTEALHRLIHGENVKWLQANGYL